MSELVDAPEGAKDALQEGDVAGSVVPDSGAVDPMDDFDPYDDDECANCGGEGYVSNCFQEFACFNPDEGCEDCMRRCDWCSPRQVRPSDADPFVTPTAPQQESANPSPPHASQLQGASAPAHPTPPTPTSE